MPILHYDISIMHYQIALHRRRQKTPQDSPPLTLMVNCEHEARSWILLFIIYYHNLYQQQQNTSYLVSKFASSHTHTIQFKITRSEPTDWRQPALLDCSIVVVIRPTTITNSTLPVSLRGEFSILKDRASKSPLEQLDQQLANFARSSQIKGYT